VGLKAVSTVIHIIDRNERHGLAETTTETTMTAIVSPERFVQESADWSYADAFQRNLGLVTPAEQERIRSSRVAIAGLGGVGGVHLVTLARLGIGKFTIADPDTFAVANRNRQYGALESTVGCSKARVMAEMAIDVNPEIDLRTMEEPVGPDNVDEFLAGADLFVDGIEFFEINARRLLFREARRRGIPAITAGPLGFSTAWLVFTPDGMEFDSYFDFRPEMDYLDQLIALAVGLAPRATQLPYMDLRRVDWRARTNPSAGLACQLAAGVTAAEAVKLLLRRGRVRPAPYYQQFDPFVGRFIRGRVRSGNRHPVQRLKRWLLRRRVDAMERKQPGNRP
jgi:molybdopterin/thiamine biosynthesis adenylyltransferase